MQKQTTTIQDMLIENNVIVSHIGYSRSGKMSGLFDSSKLETKIFLILIRSASNMICIRGTSKIYD